MTQWTGDQFTWLKLQPDTGKQSAMYYVYPCLLTVACILAALSLILQFGFVLPEEAARIVEWGDFPLVCLFLALAVMRFIQAKKTASAIRYALIEMILIGALAVDFIVLRAFFPEKTRFTLDFIHIYIIVLQIYFLFEIGRSAYLAGKRLSLLSFSPAGSVVLSFLGLILLGTVGLLLPRATHGELTPNISLIDALFTSTSAVCVTGLITVDTATAFSSIGQSVILILIQLGAFGIMIFVGLFAFTFGSSASIRSRTIMQDLLAKEGGQRVSSLLRTMFVTTIILETIGAMILYPCFLSNSDAPGTAAFNAVFHSISAFCNAGFSTFPDSLESYSASPVIILTVSFLIFSGGIGFGVVFEVYRWLQKKYWYQKKAFQLTLHTRAVLYTSFVLLGAGFIVLLAGADWSGRSLLDIFLSSGFQSVTTRTAGFNSIPLTSIAPWCLIVMMILMFIGGAPGGTAGGIKVSTVALLYHTSRCLLKGRQYVEIGHRTIAQQVIMSAFVISGLSVAYVALATIALMWAEPNQDFFQLLFEVISAFGTVGLSLGVTGQLSPIGKIIIIVTMYLGRVGPLTIFLALMKRRDEALYEYPSGSIVVS